MSQFTVFLFVIFKYENEITVGTWIQSQDDDNNGNAGNRYHRLHVTSLMILNAITWLVAPDHRT